jgi:hypothetical protein
VNEADNRWIFIFVASVWSLLVCAYSIISTYIYREAYRPLLCLLLYAVSNFFLAYWLSAHRVESSHNMLRIINLQDHVCFREHRSQSGRPLCSWPFASYAPSENFNRLRWRPYFSFMLYPPLLELTYCEESMAELFWANNLWRARLRIRIPVPSADRIRVSVNCASPTCSH